MKLSENEVSGIVRLDAEKHDVLLFRNNVGAYKARDGRWVRYGLCNESEKQNQEYKSSDYIGIKRVTITADMVGQTIGQFVARENKHSDWEYTGEGREPAQLAFIEMVRYYGGDADFATGPGTFGDDVEGSTRKPRMPRARRRHMILEATLKTINELQCAEISFKDVARKANLTYYGIKNYFPNQVSLLESALEIAQQKGDINAVRLICTQLASKKKD